jgi:hypothetical protein
MQENAEKCDSNILTFWGALAIVAPCHKNLHSVKIALYKLD